MQAALRTRLRQTGSAPVLVVFKPGVTRKQFLEGAGSYMRAATQPALEKRGRSARKSIAALALEERPEGTANEAPAAAPVKARFYPRLGVAAGYVDLEGAQELDARSEVRSVHHLDSLVLIAPVARAAATASGSETWGLRKLDIPKLWAKGYTGKGVKVGHIDTGVDARHPALKGKVAGFLEVDMDGDPVPGAKPRDSADHGTHTAGTLVGGKLDGTGIGVAPDAQLYSALSIEGGQAMLRVLEGMEWALSSGIRVLNMSLGFPGYRDFFLDVTRNLRAQGVLPVFAIGNEGPMSSRSPGNYEQALSVGALDEQTMIATFSSSMYFKDREAWVPDVLAPGTDVFSARPGGGGQNMSGTSMATPHVAGVAALLLQAKPSATVDELESALTRTALKVPTSDIWGVRYGAINPLAALDALLAS